MEGGSLKDPARSGRPPKLTQDDIKSLVAKATGAKLSSSRIIAAELEPSKVSFETVCRHAKKSGLKIGAPRMNSEMTAKKKTQRVAFGLKHIQNGTDFQKWMFTDSKYFCVSNDSIRCWYKTGEQPAIAHERHAPKVHVYLGVTYFGATKPLFVSGGAQQSKFTNASGHACRGIGSLEYNEVILPHLIMEGNDIFISRLYQNKWILQHDNAPSHTASMNRAFLNHHLPGRWCEDWAPHSPDLSWIENV